MTLNESGLPNGQQWGITVNNETSTAVAPAPVYTALPNGTFPYALLAVPGYWQVTLPSAGMLTIAGEPLAEPTLAYHRTVYPVEFNETGLPPGGTWSVTVNGTLYVNAIGTMISLSLPNGTEPYSIGEVPGWIQSTLASSGNLTVRAAPLVEPTLVYSRTPFTVSFTESGLPNGTDWIVEVNGTIQSTPAPGPIDFSLANGSYSFELTPVTGYNDSPSRGNFSVQGSSLVVSVEFRSTVPETFLVEFAESGLPEHATWGIVLSGHPALTSLAPGSIEFHLPNGIYNYSVLQVPGYVGETGGRFTMAGGLILIPILFTPFVYALTFAEIGLPAGTPWSITLSADTQGAVAPNPIPYFEANGTYHFVVGSVPGYNASPSGGTVSIHGESNSTLIKFSALEAPSPVRLYFTFGGSSSSYAWLALIAIIPAIGGAIFLFVGRKR
ncbi:MAG: hypothetical protein ACREBZ_06440 [Thermoplasmata archaeon]